MSEKTKSPMGSLRRAPPFAVAALLAAALTLAGCGTFNDATRSMANAMTLYKPEVVQGNFVSKEQVAALRPGMTRLQVRDILGTPLLVDMFRNNRWDYVFTIKRQGVPEQQYRLTVFFDGDHMVRTEGDEMPSETEFIDRISPKKKVKVPSLEATPEQLAKYPAPTTPATPTATNDAGAPPAPAASYPPLESH
jgi:outer membrane protein assembly factor BamE